MKRKKCTICKTSHWSTRAMWINMIKGPNGQHDGEVTNVCADCRQNKLELYEASGYWLK